MKPNKRRLLILVAILALLAIPLIAMQLTAEVNWSPADFLVMGILLLGMGLGIDYVLGSIQNALKRQALITIAVIVFLLLWAELAVGIFGTPLAGN